MTTIPTTHNPGLGAAAPAPDTAGLPASLVLLLAAGAGLSVASLYYSQPILGLLAEDLQAGTGTAGLLPTLTQLGYALGIFFLAPLGDRFDRRRIILAKAALLSLALAASALSWGMGGLLGAALVVGLSATLAQDIVPAAATLAPAAQRGRTVGAVMTGLLLGILLSRVVSGLVAQRWGWQTVYACAALSVAAIGLVAWRRLPRFAPSTQLGYGALLASMAGLWRQHAALRRATWTQGLLALGFSAFWTTLAVMLHQRFGLGSAVAGAFGLAGAAGALAAPLAGRLADRRGPLTVARLGAVLTVLAFAALALDGGLPPAWQLALLVVCTVAFDFGVQATLVAHQTLVYGIDAQARSRLNAVLFTGMFIGMATGGGLGSLALAQGGWHAVVGLMTASALLGLVVRLRG